MAQFFRNELALIIGILCAKHFSGRIFGWTPPGLGLGNQVYIPEPSPPKEQEGAYGTGRGGYYKDHNGDLGRPGLGDEQISGISLGLAGQGGTLDSGGMGFLDGLFGVANKLPYNVLNDHVSAGGGNGWFGGGHSYLGAGGGGASSFVLSTYGWNQLGNDIKSKIIDYYLSLLPEDVVSSITEEEALEYVQSFFGDWYDRREEAYGNYPYMYDLNTREQSVLIKKGFDFFIPFRERLDGDGAVLVSKLNTKITYNLETNEFENLDKIYYYTGKDQELIIEEDGEYHIICYGACGGDRWRGTDERYHGGYGGCASGVFNFKAGTKLYVIVGSKGYRQSYRYYNSSIGAGYCTGGGSSSDVRYALNIPESRIIVAGGGGGVFAKFDDGQDPPDDDDIVEIPTEPFNPETDEEGNPVEEEHEAKFKNMKFMVNDRSIVHVMVKSYNQLEIPDFAMTHCSIYLNDGLEGELHKASKPKGGTWTYEFQFPLDTIYPPNTPTHEVTIEAIIKTNFYSILATDGIMIWVTTRYSLTDTPTDNKIKISNHQDEFSIKDYYTIERLVKKQITLDIEDTLCIDDFYNVLMELKGVLERFVYDDINIQDFYSKLVKLLNYKEINISDDYKLEDFKNFEKLSTEEQKDIIREILDLIDINDFYEAVKFTKTESDSIEYSEEEIEDKIAVSLVHLEYLYSNIEDTFEINDYVNIELIKEE